MASYTPIVAEPAIYWELATIFRPEFSWLVQNRWKARAQYTHMELLWPSQIPKLTKFYFSYFPISFNLPKGKIEFNAKLTAIVIYPEDLKKR